MKKKSNHIFRQHFILQGVLDYWDLDSQYFNIPGTMKYSIYSSTNSLIIGISILGIVVSQLWGTIMDPVIPIIKDALYIAIGIFLSSDPVDKYY